MHMPCVYKHLYSYVCLRMYNFRQYFNVVISFRTTYCFKPNVLLQMLEKAVDDSQGCKAP